MEELFHRILISQAVDIELRALDKPGSCFSDLEWVKVVPVKNKEIILFLKKDIDTGEAETIALAKQMNADVVIIDENAGYQIAKHLDLPVVRTLYQTTKLSPRTKNILFLPATLQTRN